ncbi:potassium channel protein [Halalkalibacter alkaliphilus]|uniref:NAD-binding protein n=1 Tax=Halalkalibacter alkaliphilus TaxID=2917993 RepID=A0A9X2CSE0_9BACI|nr:potassium channel protein [Halalkalibacter alkaliphilus]MCL7747318.1 NAD-binding protein [Halalkalibacter alkaliphilus]
MLMIFEIMKMAVNIRKLTLLLITVIFLISSSFIIHWLEPAMFENPFIGFWYVMTTVTTTGYGDFVPDTTIGKIFGLFLYFFGIGLIGIVIGKIVEGFGLLRKLKEEGKLNYKGKGHYVIIGWSNKAKHTMNEILEIDDQAKILVVDSLPKSPLERDKFSYIQGDATDLETLEKANVLEAKAVLIFTGDKEFNPVAADGQSLLIVSAIESYAVEMNQEIYTIVEILKEKHISNFEHANVDEFIIADEALSDLMAKAAVDKGSSKLIMELLSRRSGVDIRKITKKQVWKTYNDAFEDLKKLGANLISDRNDFQILTKLGESIPKEAELYAICTKESYEKIMKPH